MAKAFECDRCKRLIKGDHTANVSFMVNVELPGRDRHYSKLGDRSSITLCEACATIIFDSLKDTKL